MSQISKVNVDEAGWTKVTKFSLKLAWIEFLSFLFPPFLPKYMNSVCALGICNNV